MSGLLLRSISCLVFAAVLIGSASARQTMIQMPSPSQERFWEIAELERIERCKPSEDQVWEPIISAYSELHEETGHAEAAYNLAKLYRDGGAMNGFEHWIARAAESGSPRSQAEYGAFLVEENSDCETGMAWIAAAADGWSGATDRPDVQRALAICER